MNDVLPKKWAGGICIKDESVLLIYRLNKEKDFNQEYFMFPGGEVEEDESLEDALVREFDEAGVKVKMGELFYSTEEDEDKAGDYYYLCDYMLGELSATKDKEEGERMKDGLQIYTPMWVPLSDLDNLIVYPEDLKNKVLFELSSGN